MATLVAPWFLKETYKLDPLWIQFFVLYKIDEWAQIDLSTPSAPKLHTATQLNEKCYKFFQAITFHFQEVYIVG